MIKVSVVIPNYNGIKFLGDCLTSLQRQSFREMEIILVDNGSEDGSVAYVQQKFPEVRLIKLDKNYGFCKAVNRGIAASSSKYILLLNNDIKADRDFVKEMYRGMQVHKRCFSCSGQLRKMSEPDKIDDAGDYYCALGWAFAFGKDRPAENYQKSRKVFASCGGAAIYRKAILDKIGCFDEKHFAYMEDIDLGYRAQIHGYENWYLPKAIVYHAGSGTTGSRYNEFKVRYSSRNNIYMIYKNMPALQLLFNMPMLLTGFVIKTFFFTKKGMGKTYVRGLAEGVRLSKSDTKRYHSVKNWKNYIKIQYCLWKNIIVRVIDAVS